MKDGAVVMTLPATTFVPNGKIYRWQGASFMVPNDWKQEPAMKEPYGTQYKAANGFNFTIMGNMATDEDQRKSIAELATKYIKANLDLGKPDVTVHALVIDSVPGALLLAPNIFGKPERMWHWIGFVPGKDPTIPTKLDIIIAAPPDVFAANQPLVQGIMKSIKLPR